MTVLRLAPLLPALLPTLLLVACGRTEPVDELPTQDELAAAANAAAAKAIANASEAHESENRNYVNLERGFSITFPDGWTQDKAADSTEGVVYKDPGAGADVRVFWQKNDADQDLQQIVEAINDGGTVDGDMVGENEYRGTADDGEGNRVSVRLLKQPDGSIVTATFVYPENLSEQYQPIAKTVLDSLRIFPPKAQTAEGVADNAANAVR